MNTMKLLVSLQRLWRPRPLVWALALAGVATHTLVPGVGEARAAGALPTGLNVVRGQVNVAQAGGQMTVTNSAGAVLNWQSFNIGVANTVRFEQPSASSRVLNRVVGNDPSQIFGKLTSNGEVWLVNPYGVLFGRDARVDVGSLVISTLHIGNDDWRAGRFSLTGGAGNGAPIVNQGELRTVTGGRVFLVAGSGGVRNEGLISAPDGQVALAAGASVDLVDTQTRHLAVRVEAPQGEVLNLGSIAAGGGRVDLAAAMVNQQGFVRADSLSGSGGQIVITGSDGVNLAAGSVTSAAGAAGGQVLVDGGRGTTMLAGEVNVTGSRSKGGDALLLGLQVGLLDGALADASGATGGGRVRVGGGLQGKDSSVTNARAVFMGQGAGIHADATRSGNGGTIVLWSDEATRAYGSLSARGGAEGGNGGFIETSGGWIDVQPASIRADATSGRAGQWLLDPNNITIQNSTFSTNITGAPNFTSTGDSAILPASTIQGALAQGNSVTVTTSSGGANSQAGNITVASGVTLGSSDTGATPVSLTLNASNDIVVQSGVNFQTGGAPLNLTFNAARNIAVTQANFQGTVPAPMNVTMSAANGSAGLGSIVITDSTINTGGGNIVLGGGHAAVGPNLTSPVTGAVGFAHTNVDGTPLTAVGVDLQGAVLNAGAGNIRISGLSTGGGGAGSYGVRVGDGFQDGASSLTAKDINIYGWVDSNSAEDRRGISVEGPASVVSASHGLTLTGLANSTVYQAPGQSSAQPIGVFVSAKEVSVRPDGTDTTASMTIDGTVNDGAPPAASLTKRYGVLLAGGTAFSASGGAQVSITGHDQMNVPGTSLAIQLTGGPTYDFSAAGAVRIDGDTRVSISGTVQAPAGQALTINAGDVLTLETESLISGQPITVSLSGLDIDFRGAVGIAPLNPATVSFTAKRDVLFEFASSVISTGAPTTVNITAAAGASGQGSVEVNDSRIISNGGDITIGGGSVATGPNTRSPVTGAIVTDGDPGVAGVGLYGADVEAGTGTLRITGQSLIALDDTAGVWISSGEGAGKLRGRNIDIFGWVDSNGAVSRAGVRIDQNVSVVADNSLKITGIANSSVFNLGDVAPIGVQIDGTAGLLLPPQLVPRPLQTGAGILEVAQPLPTQPNQLVIQGTTNDGARTDANAPTRYGVLISPTAVVTTSFTDFVPRPGAVAAGTLVSAGPVVTITGTDLSPNNEVAVRTETPNADFQSASSLTITGVHRVELAGTLLAPTAGTVDAHASTTLKLDQVQMSGAPTTVSLQGDTRLDASGTVTFPQSATGLTLRSPEVHLGVGGAFTANTLGTIRLFTDRYVTELPSTLTAGATGTALVIAGADGASNVAQVQVTTQPTTLAAPNGRWLLYMADDSYAATGLNFVFRQYNMTYPAEPVATGSGLVYSLAPVLTLTGTTTSPITKVYDGTNAVTSANPGLQLTGLRPFNFLDSQVGPVTLTYATANAGTNQLLNVAGYVQPTISDNGERPVYGYTTQFNVRGDVTPRPLTLTGVVADPRLYDGSRAAGLSGGVLGNLVAGESLTLLLGGGQFDTANVGTGKTVTGQATLGNSTGLASNYSLAGGGALTLSTGVISPRTLEYVAQPATLTTTQLPSTTLTGSVTGFIEGESLGNATGGTLRFTTPATANSAAGRYAILGSGLTATNYVFAQSEGNATALTLLAASRIAPLPEGLPEIEDTTRAYRQALPPLPRGPEGTRALDAMQTMRMDPTWLSMSFGELDLSSMSREEIAALLEARRQYKMQVLAVGRERLTQDPSLADVPACQTARQSETGRCLVSAELLAAIDAGGENASIDAPGPAPVGAPLVAAPQPAAAPAPAPVAAAPAAAPAARPPAPAPAPAPVAAAPAVPAPTPAAPGVAVAAPALPRPGAVEARTPPRVRVAAKPVLVPPPIPSARSVQSASIPQIQRKIAVLVGIDNYVDERIPALDNARRDVDAVARVLEQRLGYETLIVRDAGREAMVGLLNRLALQVRPNDSVVVYYAGHGTVIDDTKQGYWIPATADAERPETWISNRDIGRLLGSLRASQVVLISDSCFSGSLVGDKRVLATSTTDARVMLQRRATLVMSSGGDEPVADGAIGGHSPFSNSLMATLQGLDNWRVGGNVFDKVRDDVTKRLPQTPRYGPARDARSVDGADYLFEQRQLGQR